MPSISIYNELTNFSGSGSGSGSYIDEFVYNDGNSDDDDYDSNANSLLFLLIPLGPVIIAVIGFMFVCFSDIRDELYKKCKNYKWKYDVWVESKNAPIFNGTLSSKYITTLNTNNHSKIDKKEQLDCSICLEPINLEKFKLKKNDLVFLECGHVYHKGCLQSWVKSQIKNIDKPNCPMCRTMIVDYFKKEYTFTNYDSDNSVNSDYSYGSEWD